MAVLPVPGFEVDIVDVPRSLSAPTDTGQALFVGEAERGPLTPILCQSFDDFAAGTGLGARQSYSYLSDAVETFFREGGHQCWVSRAVAASAVAASANLADSVPATTLVVTAKGPGAYFNAAKVQVLTNADDASITSGSVKFRITENGVIVEDSPVFADKTSALNWAATNAQTFTLTSGIGTGMPVRVVSPGTALTGGNDNRGSIADGDFQAALNRLTPDLGPGQVLMPGHTTDARHVMLITHALTTERHAIPDLPDTATTATVIASAAAVDAAANKAGRWGAGYWPWAVIPGLSGAPFSTRLVPWSAVQAGICARVDVGGNPNVPAAGVLNGVARWATGLSQDTRSLDQTTLGSLNDNGVNVVKILNGSPTTYGNRTFRTYAEDPLWLQASGSRLAMAIAAKGGAIIQRYVHSQVDVKRVQQGHLQGELEAMMGAYDDLGALYGFAADAGPDVNPLDQLALGRLKAALQWASSPGADRVELDLSRTAITTGVN